MAMGMGRLSDAPLNRGHMAAFIERAFRDYLPNGKQTFKDVNSIYSH